MIPVVTFLAMTLADIAVGSIIIEQVFAIPGTGRLLLLSISNRDYPVVQAIVVIIASLVVAVNFLADLAYQYIDPRIRLS
jgi:ABC-type dipeptide/oligopeptide/nickel transport system permease component